MMRRGFKKFLNNFNDDNEHAYGRKHGHRYDREETREHSEGHGRSHGHENWQLHLNSDDHGAVNTYSNVQAREFGKSHINSVKQRLSENYEDELEHQQFNGNHHGFKFKWKSYRKDEVDQGKSNNNTAVVVEPSDGGVSEGEMPNVPVDVTDGQTTGDQVADDSQADQQDETGEDQAGTELIQFDADSNTYTITEGVTAAEINMLIENAGPSAKFILRDGTHQFAQSIIINRDDISLSGQSEAGTILNFTFAEETGSNAIEITGGERSLLTVLEANGVAGSHKITLVDASTISAGDVIYLTQPNTVEYLLENNWTNVSFEDADSRPFRELIVRVGSVENNTLTLESPLPYDFDPSVTQVFTTDLLKNVLLSNFTVTSGIDAEPNYYDYVNSLPEFENTSVILVNGADGIDVSSISILDAPSSAFDFRSTIDLVADNLYVNGAHNLGGSGNGYGVNLYETFDATITDIEIFNVRHAVLFSSWNAEVGNYIEVAETNRDINFHGSPDVDNEVVVLRSVLDYDPIQNTGSGIGFWDIVSGGGSSHANIDIFADNKVVFNHGEGSTGTEILYGADSGSYLDGKGSQDILIGGIGDDIIIGGTSQDVLTGGDGADLFAFTLGDSFDAITDFSGLLQRDRIVIFNPEVQSFDDLIISQNEDDAWVRYGSSSTIIFSDFDAALLQPEFFMFNTGDLL